MFEFCNNICYAVITSSAGDMYDVFLKVNDEGRLELCDMGATLMRLSYTFELNSDTRMEILGDILQSSCIENNRGNLYVATTEDDFLPNLLNFSLTMSKIVNMDILKWIIRRNS